GLPPFVALEHLITRRPTTGPPFTSTTNLSSRMNPRSVRKVNRQSVDVAAAAKLVSCYIVGSLSPGQTSPSMNAPDGLSNVAPPSDVTLYHHPSVVSNVRALTMNGPRRKIGAQSRDRMMRCLIVLSPRIFTMPISISPPALK